MFNVSFRPFVPAVCVAPSAPLRLSSGDTTEDIDRPVACDLLVAEPPCAVVAWLFEKVNPACVDGENFCCKLAVLLSEVVSVAPPPVLDELDESCKAVALFGGANESETVRWVDGATAAPEPADAIDVTLVCCALNDIPLRSE